MSDYSDVAARFASHEMTVLHEDGLYRLTDPGCVLRATARRDLEVLHRAGHLTLVDQPDNRHYTLTTRKEAS